MRNNSKVITVKVHGVHSWTGEKFTHTSKIRGSELLRTLAEHLFVYVYVSAKDHEKYISGVEVDTKLSKKQLREVAQITSNMMIEEIDMMSSESNFGEYESHCIKLLKQCQDVGELMNSLDIMVSHT